jgi:hypothetical protein
MKHKVINHAMILILIGCSAIPAVGADSEELLSLENKYIKVFINNSIEETGRFAVDTTGGDPARADDDSKPLIYGHPKPWTSFTTLRIDGVNYVFGKATHKRSGAGLPDGEILQPPQVSDNQITMKCKYGAVEVEQLLDIARSPSTGALDTARIRYTLSNTGSTPVEVGIRALLDTMLGDNDGAPFRIGDKTITTDYSYNGNECPDFWQAFDSLLEPAVIAQCTLRGGDVLIPDRMLFTNWGKAADNPWDVGLENGADFTRLGEDELDSAVAMYWNPRTLRPGAQLNVTMYYGLGGITFAPGTTYLGITAPAEVQYSIINPRSYTIMMYLEHRGEAKAENVKINLNLPEGLECVGGKTAIVLPELIPGVTRQFSWDIKPNGLYQGDTSFQIKVSGDHLESNTVTRKIRIVGPPHLVTAIEPPVLKIVNHTWAPYPAPLTVKIQNSGESPAYDLKAAFTADSGVTLTAGECVEKYLLNLGGKEETSVTWQIVPTGNVKSGSFKILITGVGIKPLTVNGQMDIPALTTRLGFDSSVHWALGQVVNLDLFAYNLQDILKFRTDVKYDPKQLRLVYVSRGTFLVEEQGMAQWNSGVIDNQNGLAASIFGIRSHPFSGDAVTLMRLNFIVLSAGNGRISLENSKIVSSSGIERVFSFAPLSYQIEEEKK